MFTQILQPWHFGRIIRALLSVFILVSGIRSGDVVVTVFGAAVLLMALFNVLPCGACTTPVSKRPGGETATVEYEEIGR
jgi:hypothetical protein